MSVTTDSGLIEVAEDVAGFTAQALARGWSDGLPVLHPTADLVAEFVSASGLPRDTALGVLYPSGADCTVELAAVNAVMAGAPAASMPLIVAAVSAMADSAFDLAGINATTASVVPAMVVSGSIRDELPIPYQRSAWGGVAGPAPAIGRAIRLIIRNVAGQVSGKTSESVFGQPGRITGIVTAEWEEESPWDSVGVRRGVDGSSVTMFGVLGTANILNPTATNADEILEVIGKSMGYMGNNNMAHTSYFAHQVTAINPIWAQMIHAEYPNLEDVQTILYNHASLPIDWFPKTLQPLLEKANDVKDGRVYLMDEPSDVTIVVNGGKGSLHATMLPGMSNMIPVTRSLDSSTWVNRQDGE